MLSILADAAPRLPEKVLIENIEALAARFTEREGAAPVHVSHWNPSDEFVRQLRARLPGAARFDFGAALAARDPVPYRHSHAMQEEDAILHKLGFDSASSAVLITENGSSSIAAVANWLRLNGVAEVVLLAPYYFSTQYHLRRLGIAVREVALTREDGGYSLPLGLELRRGQALWLTNPVYSTGVHARERDCETLRRFADAGVVIVADEVMALRPTALARALRGHRNFVGIYAPHKSICMNGIKFAAVVFHPCHRTAFADWAEVLSGALSLAAVIAAEHFLSGAFDAYRDAFLAQTRAVRRWHAALVEAKLGVEADADSHGHFLMAYAPGITEKPGRDLDMIEDILTHTGCTVVPGSCSGFDPRRAFCFRVNLARDSRAFRVALEKLYDYLGAKAAAAAIRASAVASA